MQRVDQLVLDESTGNNVLVMHSAPRFQSSALTRNTVLFKTVVILLDFVNSDTSSSASQVCFLVLARPYN